MKFEHTLEGNNLTVKIHNVLTGYNMEEIVINVTCVLQICVAEMYKEDEVIKKRLLRKIEKLRTEILG